MNTVEKSVSGTWDYIAGMEIPLKSHKFDECLSTLEVLDQCRIILKLLLPHQTIYVPVISINDAYAVIRNMQVGMLSLVVDLAHDDHQYDSIQSFIKSLKEKCDFLVSARPTAVNLFKAVEQLKDFVTGKMPSEGTIDELKTSIKEFILKWQKAERKENSLLIGNSITRLLQIKNEGFVLMTICNTGALATSSFGTALGVIVHMHRLGKLKMAIALETRPYNQGSRLTSYELQTFGVPFIMIADGAAASAIRNFGVDAILVGADQVAMNGDTANKIGTFSLAILAKHSKVPFFVVTPTSSINLTITNGDYIKIEERPAEELTVFNGARTCLAGCPVWNPGFDITPASLVTEILTEFGNFRPECLHSGLKECQSNKY